MKSINGFSHISIKICDMEAALKFYCDGLGLTLKFRNKSDDTAVLLTPDNFIIELSGGGEYSENKSGITHICFNTYDADAAFARAIQYGGKISRAENPEPYNYNALKMAFVRSPTGEEIEFWYIEKNGVKREEITGNRYIKNVPHIALTVPDMQKCIDFYVSLGAELKSEWGWGCSLRLADMREIEIFTGAEYSDNQNGIVHWCFLTDDVEASCKQMGLSGGKIVSPVYEWENIRYAFCRGISGEVTEFFTVFPDKEGSIFDVVSDPLENLFE